MFKHFCVLLNLLLFACLVYGFSPETTGPRYPPTKGEVWPKPQYEKRSESYFTFNPSNFNVKVVNVSCPLLESTVERYTFRLKHTFSKLRSANRSERSEPEDAEDPLHAGLLRELKVELNAPCETVPQFDMDESYTLDLGDSGAHLTAPSIWGIIRGFETFTHLHYFSADYEQLRFRKTYISDFPRYSHRGLLLDTSRHYVSMTNILKTLDAMAINKMNVFHWHIVDDQSFPYESKVFPELSAKGAYLPNLIYTKKDIQVVLKYATMRGIRVLPEFDVPGHTRSWGNAYPQILTECYSGRRVTGLGPLNPIKNETYEMLGQLINEVQRRFPDKYFHVGGDEVLLDCWKSNPEIAKYMREKGLSTNQLHGLFMEKVIPLLGERSIPIVWQEVFDEGVALSDETLIQVWKWEWVDEMVKILRKGHRLIFSASWYLDGLKSGGDWADFYVADPREMVAGMVSNVTDLENIVGGEACMWGEVVDDTNVISRVWPRASAVAERLWSPALDTSTARYRNLATVHQNAVEAARGRLEEHTCRMRGAGLKAQPPSGPGFCYEAY